MNHTNSLLSLCLNLCSVCGFASLSGAQPQSINSYLAALHHLQVSSGLPTPICADWSRLHYTLRGIQHLSPTPAPSYNSSHHAEPYAGMVRNVGGPQRPPVSPSSGFSASVNSRFRQQRQLWQSGPPIQQWPCTLSSASTHAKPRRTRSAEASRSTWAEKERTSAQWPCCSIIY